MIEARVKQLEHTVSQLDVLDRYVPPRTNAAIAGGVTASVGLDSNLSTVYIDRYVIIDPYTVGAEIGVITGADAIAPVINATFDNSHSSGVPVLIVDRGAYLQAEWFGLDEGNSAANNNTAIADFIAAVKATTLRGLFPHGEFNISATITVTDVGGMKLMGAGSSWVSDPTVFNWQGNGTDPAFRTVGARECEFGGFKVYINGATYSLNIGVQSHTSTTTGFSATRNLFKDIVIEPSTTGVLTRGFSVDDAGPNGDNNNDFMRFEQCACRFAQYGFYMDATQAKNTYFWDCNVESDTAGNSDYALYCIGGSFHWYGGSCNNSAEYDFYCNNLTDVSSITNIQSEGSAGFLHMAGPTAAQVTMTVEGVRWDRSNSSISIATSNRVIKVQTAGNIIVSNSEFTCKTSETMRVQFDAAGNTHGSMIVRQCYIWDGSTNPEDVFENPNAGALYLRGNIHRDASANFDKLPDRTDGAITNLGRPLEVSIASGVIAFTQSRIKADTEGDASTDDLVTINGGRDGDLLYLRSTVTGRDVVVKNGTGNIYLSGSDFTLDNIADLLVLMFDAQVNGWVELSRSNNGA